MKTISKEELVKFVTVTGQDIGWMVNVLDRYYCTPMNRMGQCSTACHNCKVRLCNIFMQYALYDRPLRSPRAVMRFLIREGLADVAESMETSARPDTDWLGQPRRENIFAMYERAFDVERT